MIEIVTATLEHALELSKNLRQSDIEEIADSSGRTPEDALKTAYEISNPLLRWTALMGGKPIVMWGAASSEDPRVGSAWLLASNDIYKIKKRFLQECPKYIALMHFHHPFLFNWVSCQHRASLTWLHDLGFKVTGFDPRYGKGKKPFLMFTSRDTYYV